MDRGIQLEREHFTRLKKDFICFPRWEELHNKLVWNAKFSKERIIKEMNYTREEGKNLFIWLHFYRLITKGNNNFGLVKTFMGSRFLSYLNEK